MKFDKQQYAEAKQTLQNALRHDMKDAELVGTLYTIGEGNDMDICVLVRDVDDATISLEEHSYEQTGLAGYDDDEFTTFRKGEVNVMLTDNKEWFAKFLTAAEVCRYLKLDTKELRKAVHRIIMNDATATGEDGEVRDYNWEDNTPPHFPGGPLRSS